MVKKDVATKEDSAVAVPSFMQDHMGKGAEGLSDRALETPRIKLIQATSPELDDDDDVKPGDWLASLSGEVFGKEVDVVPCFITESCILWRPLKDGGGILARSNDGKVWHSGGDKSFDVKLDGTKPVTWESGANPEASGLLEWGSEDPDDTDSYPAATMMLNVVFILPDFPHAGPVVMTFQRSGMKTGKRFVSQLNVNPLPIYGQRFKLVTKKMTGDGNAWYEPRIKRAGLIQDAEEFARYAAVYKHFNKMGVQVSEADLKGSRSDGPSDGDSTADSEDY